MVKFRYLTHPQVRMDPAVPVPRWGLSDLGRQRMEEFKSALCLRDTRLIVSSGETKALETAAILADHLSVPLHVRETAHENDRSATGYLPPPEFEAVADQFFASPESSVRGWERAVDAQTRIVKVFNAFAASASSHDILFVGHGGVGTLLYCHIAKQPIARMSDQPAGGGNLFGYDLDTQTLIHGWKAMESFSA